MDTRVAAEVCCTLTSCKELCDTTGTLATLAADQLQAWCLEIWCFFFWPRNEWQGLAWCHDTLPASSLDCVHTHSSLAREQLCYGKYWSSDNHSVSITFIPLLPRLAVDMFVYITWCNYVVLYRMGWHLQRTCYFKRAHWHIRGT